MNNIVTRISDTRIELRDAEGRVIGTISRPLDPDVVGPGREKVYLARRSARTERPPQNHAA